jgi:hypothetical protein
MALGRPLARSVPLVKLAAGGTATVHVGVHAASGGDLVAIKRPHPHVLDDERQRSALLREADIASTLHHPNLVGVRAIEGADAELELILDYVEGASLAALLVLEARRDARIPPAVAARIVLDACAGLAAVHARGLVHRDVSPQNILVGTDGVARLTDFGLAKALYEGAPSTTQGTLKGKLGYMAPEYVSRSRLSAAVDVFALGVVLWEALAGRRLFRGDNEAQTLDHVLREEAPALGAEIDPSLAPFDPVVARAVAKDPVERFATAEELGEALAAAASAAGLEAGAPGVAAYVAAAAGAEIADRRARVADARAALARRRRVRLAWIVAAIGAPAIAFAVLGAVSVREHRDRAHAVAPAPAVPDPAATTATADPSSAALPAIPTSTASDSAMALPSAAPRDVRPAAAQRPVHLPPPNPYVHRAPPR